MGPRIREDLRISESSSFLFLYVLCSTDEWVVLLWLDIFISDRYHLFLSFWYFVSHEYICTVRIV